MPKRTPEEEAVVNAAIDLDAAISNAVARLEQSPDDHDKHAGRWLARAIAHLDVTQSLQGATAAGGNLLVAPPILKPLGADATQRPTPRSWTSDEDHAWLQKHMRGDVVEVGSAAGASAAAMIHVHRLTCVDLWCDPGDAAYPDCPSRFAEFQANLAEFPHRARVDAIQAPSLAAANAFESESLDCVFLDADHRREAVAADIDAWLPKLRPAGLLCGHDYGHPDFPGVKEAVDARFGDAVRTSGTIWYHRLPSLFPGALA